MLANNSLFSRCVDEIGDPYHRDGAAQGAETGGGTIVDKVFDGVEVGGG
jgi:hypothetical protein